MDRKAAASGMVLLLLVAALVATELARPQSPFELSGDATRGSRGGTRSGSPAIAQPTILLERPPTCTDGLRNGVEADVDCGGAVCPRCALGKSCVAASDCSTNTCQAGTCQLPPPPPPTCADGIKNGAESDVDCGGDLCIAQGKSCGVTKVCISNRDCTSSRCNNGVCEASDTCTDGIKNGGETGVDCGGSGSGFGRCTRCADGIACAANADCISSRCVSGVCQALPTCTDAIKNGAETAVDCGGSTCPKCSNGAICLVASDCSSSNCVIGLCQALPTCTDGIKNGAETGVDCGGPTCPKCANGIMCSVNSDCNSNTCVSGLCAAACVPQWRNQGSCTAPCGQTGNYQQQIDGCGNTRTVSCSGQACPKAGYCGSCESSSGCQSGYCYYGSCINRGDEIGNWGNFNYCSEGESCDSWAKPVRIERAVFACGNAPQGGWTAYYRGNVVDSANYACQPWPNNVIYINWGPPYLGWIDKVVSYGAANRQGGFGPSAGFQSPCSRVTDYYTMG